MDDTLLGQDHGDVLDWLDPELDCGGPEFLNEVFPPTLPLSPATSDVFDESVSRVSMSMRHAYSMNDITSLQSSLATSAPMWVHQHQSRTHHVSSKPALESVPECAPAALACSNPYCPPANYTTSTAAPTNMYFAPSAKQEDSSVTAATSTFTTAAPTLSGGYSSSVEQPRAQQQQQGLSAPMYGGAAQPHQTMVPVAAPVTGRPVRNRKPTRQLPGFISEPPEHAMSDTISQGMPMPNAQSTGTPPCAPGSAATPGTPAGSAAMKWAPPAQASGTTLRKSSSALELGAWRKMAAGDKDFMDCIDPSGSVRQQLEATMQVGKLTPQERLQKILRYRAKRQMRNFNRTIKYQCRKSLADTRPRVRGRFARDNEPGSVLPHETKKAQRAKAPRGSSADADATTAGAGSTAAAVPYAAMQAGRVQAAGPASMVGHRMAPVPGPANACPAAPFTPAAAGGNVAFGMPTPMQTDASSHARTKQQSAAHSAAEQSKADVADMARLYNAWSELPLDAPLQV